MNVFIINAFSSLFWLTSYLLIPGSEVLHTVGTQEKKGLNKWIQVWNAWSHKWIKCMKYFKQQEWLGHWYNDY